MLGLMYRMLKKNTKGQAIVETALVLPIILLILLGIMEFGRIFNAYLTITYAAREAARVGALGQDDAVIVTTANDAAASLDASRLTVDVSPTAGGREHGGQLAVHIHYDLPIMTPMIGALVPNPFPLDAQTFMRIE